MQSIANYTSNTIRLNDVPLNVISSNIPMPIRFYRQRGCFLAPALNGTRDILYKMKFGDFIRVKAKYKHRYGVAAFTYGDNWYTIIRKLSDDFYGIWKVEREGFLGRRIREFKKEGKLDEYRDFIDSIYNN